MARTAQGRRLTELHRRDQVVLRSLLLARLVPLWPLLDWRRVDETTPGWLQAVMALIRVFRQRSADLSVRYYSDFRVVEAPRAAEPVPEVEFVQPVLQPLTSSRLIEELDRRRRWRLDTQEPRRTLSDTAPRRTVQRERRPARATIDWSAWDKAAEKSLAVTGPSELKRQAKRGQVEVNARRAALVTSSGAATRHALDGGRTVMDELVRHDRVAQGYMRVTDDDPCVFCAVLASRGPAFKAKSFVPSDVKHASHPKFAGDAGLSRDEAKVHDGCCCTIEPVYTRVTDRSTWPGRAAEFRELWDKRISGKYPSSAEKYSGDDSINAFRRLLEGRPRETDRF